MTPPTRLMTAPARRALTAIAALTIVLAVGACGGSATTAAPSAVIGSGGVTGTRGPSPSVGTSAAGTPVVASGATPTPAASSGAASSGASSSGASSGGPSAALSAASSSSSAPSAIGSGAPGSPGGSGGTATIGIPGLGLSLRLPTGWVGLDSTVPSTIVQSSATRFPDLADSFATLRAGGLGFVGYDATSTGPTTPHVTIATTGDAIPVASLLDALAKQMADQLATTQSISNVEHQAATMPAGPAAELRYRLAPKDGSPAVVIDSWFISGTSHTFLLTFTVPVATADAWRPQIRAVAESLAGG